MPSGTAAAAGAWNISENCSTFFVTGRSTTCSSTNRAGVPAAVADGERRVHVREKQQSRGVLQLELARVPGGGRLVREDRCRACQRADVHTSAEQRDATRPEKRDTRDLHKRDLRTSELSRESAQWLSWKQRQNNRDAFGITSKNAAITRRCAVWRDDEGAVSPCDSPSAARGARGSRARPAPDARGPCGRD